jgi:acetyl-CoA C-acetyltransferase
MGITAENVAKKYHLTREMQDSFALESQRKALKATKTGKFQNEILPVEIRKRNGEKIFFEVDEHIRETSKEALARLHPAFQEAGTVTAGNASGINDGAAAMIVASKDFIKKNKLSPQAKWLGGASCGVMPQEMGLGPIPSIRKVLEKTRLSIDEIDLFELNEAFAAQALAVMQELLIPEQKTNVNGGAIALGHPIGASGARIATTLLHELGRGKKKYGLASLCIGGGMGEATIFERDELCI